VNKLKVGKKSGLKYFDMANIRSWKPCYDPVKHLPENWRGTALTILKNEAIPFPDRLWVVCRGDVLSDRVMRLFAVWCARQVQHLMTDKRSLDAIDVAERFANGQATQAELEAARDAAWAAWAAAWAAARDAAWAAAWDAAGDAQRDKLIEMVIAEGKERLK